jgi:formyl-CoA transferase
LSSQSQWEGLYEAMGRPEWAAKEPFNTQAGRSANVEELRSRLSDWAKHEMPQDIFERIQSNKSASAPVQTAEAFYHSPQIQARDYLETVDHPRTGPLQYPGLPYQFSNLTRSAKMPAPLLGQHNETIFGQLGYSTQDILKFKQAGVI